MTQVRPSATMPRAPEKYDVRDQVELRRAVQMAVDSVAQVTGRMQDIDVVGPSSATDNAVARFDGTTGKLVQNSVVLIGDTGIVTGVLTLTGGTLVGTTRVTTPRLGTTTAVDVVFDRNSVTQLTLGSLLATFAGAVTANGVVTIAAGSTTNALSVTSTGSIIATIRRDSSNRLDVRVLNNGLVYYESIGAAPRHTFTTGTVHVEQSLYVAGSIEVTGAVVWQGTSSVLLATASTASLGWNMLAQSMTHATERTVLRLAGTIGTGATFTGTKFTQLDIEARVADGLALDATAEVSAVRIGNLNLGSGASVVTSFGLYVEGMTGATNNYAIYTNAGLVRFGGVVAVNGATPSTSTALITTAGTTAISSIRIPHGAAPTSPVNGDVWSATTGFYGRVNGGTVGPFLGGDLGVTINETGADSDTRIEGETDTNLVFVDASTDRVGIGTASPGYKFDVTGTVNTTDAYRVDGVQVVGNQGAAVADASGGATIDAEARTAINDLLARVRAHGLIAT